MNRNLPIMFGIRIERWKLWFFIFVFGFNIKNCYSESIVSNLHDLDSFVRMKINIFTKSDEHLSRYANSTNDWRCLEELNEIGIALTKFERWAAKSNL